MSELRHRYDRAAVSDRITQPPFAELADRGRRRAHRTRAVRLAGVAALAVLAAMPVLTLPGDNQPGLPGASSPPTSEPGWERHEIVVEFFDLDHGLAQYHDDTCGEGWFSVTQDAGLTWSELREYPRVPNQEGPNGEPWCVWSLVSQIAPDTLLMPGPLSVSGLPHEPFFISHDAGLTWQEYEPQVRTADSVPDGVTPRWPCDEQRCKEAGLGWYDPQTGDWMDLRNNPPGVEYDSLTVGFDGSIWVSGCGDCGPGDAFHLAVSRDRGRSWLDRSPEADIDWLTYPLLTVYDGDTAYLSPGYFEETDPFDLYRTTDGGETWQQMPAAQRFEGVVIVWATGEGGLVVEDIDDNQYLSTDGGETFARSELPVSGTLTLPGGGLQGWPHDRAAADPVDLYLSADGLTWRPVEVPYYSHPGPDDAPAATPSPAS